MKMLKSASCPHSYSAGFDSVTKDLSDLLYFGEKVLFLLDGNVYWPFTHPEAFQAERALSDTQLKWVLLFSTEDGNRDGSSELFI